MENDPYILGIDEAGRGPVLGPMVYACCFWKISQEQEILKDYKFNDSKKVKDSDRKKMFTKMKTDPRIKFSFDVLSSLSISNDMIRRDKDIINLNKISHNSAINLLNKALSDGFNITEAYLDTVGPKESYTKLIKEQCSKKYGITILAEDKADSKYPIVSAASIVAKVTRDTIVEGWDFIEDNGVIAFSKDYGSGYPSDPHTRKWLSCNLDGVFGFVSMVRFSWKPIVKVLKEKTVETRFRDYKEVGDGSSRQNYVTQNEKKRRIVERTVVERFDYCKVNGLSFGSKSRLFS